MGVWGLLAPLFSLFRLRRHSGYTAWWWGDVATCQLRMLGGLGRLAKLLRCAHRTDTRRAALHLLGCARCCDVRTLRYVGWVLHPLSRLTLVGRHQWRLLSGGMIGEVLSADPLW